jgi:starch phosphorylase
VFLDDYDMRLAMEMVQGVDVWINTPRRPWEACGTSGMKILVNGGLNLSTLDGWWWGAFASDYGWALGTRREEPQGDEQEAAELYRLLEEEVVPEFYDRDDAGLPRRWIARMRSSMASLTPRFSSVRMLQEYVERAYVPAAAACRKRTAHEGGVARDLDTWSRRLERHWSGIRFGDVTRMAGDTHLTVSVPVYLGEIPPEAVRVELYANPEGQEEPFVQQMAGAEPVPTAANAHVYRASVETTRPGWHFTPRVVPFHSEARIPIEMPLIAWPR